MTCNYKVFGRREKKLNGPDTHERERKKEEMFNIVSFNVEQSPQVNFYSLPICPSCKHHFILTSRFRFEIRMDVTDKNEEKTSRREVVTIQGVSGENKMVREL